MGADSAEDREESLLYQSAERPLGLRADRWTAPIGGGFGRLFDIGPRNVALYGQAAYNAVTPSVGSDWTTIIGFELIFP